MLPVLFKGGACLSSGHVERLVLPHAERPTLASLGWPWIRAHVFGYMLLGIFRASYAPTFFATKVLGNTLVCDEVLHP